MKVFTKLKQGYKEKMSLCLKVGINTAVQISNRYFENCAYHRRIEIDTLLKIFLGDYQTLRNIRWWTFFHFSVVTPAPEAILQITDH